MDDATDDYIDYAKALPDDNERERFFKTQKLFLKISYSAYQMTIPKI